MQRIMWIQLYTRESNNANDTAINATPLGRSDILDVPMDVVNVARLVHYIFNHEQFKKLLADSRTDEIYVYGDADCKDPVPLDELLNDIQTSASQPLRLVRPRSGSCSSYGPSFDVYFGSFCHPMDAYWVAGWTATLQSTLWLVSASVSHASAAKGLRSRLYRLADEYLGYYDPCQAKDLFYDGK